MITLNILCAVIMWFVFRRIFSRTTLINLEQKNIWRSWILFVVLPDSPQGNEKRVWGKFQSVDGKRIAWWFPFSSGQDSGSEIKMQTRIDSPRSGLDRRSVLPAKYRDDIKLYIYSRLRGFIVRAEVEGIDIVWRVKRTWARVYIESTGRAKAGLKSQLIEKKTRLKDKSLFHRIGPASIFDISRTSFLLHWFVQWNSWPLVVLHRNIFTSRISPGACVSFSTVLEISTSNRQYFLIQCCVSCREQMAHSVGIQVTRTFLARFIRLHQF